MESDIQNRNGTPTSSLCAAGLLAIGLVILQCFLPLNAHDQDRATVASLWAFALAFPLLSYRVLVDFKRWRRKPGDRNGQRFTFDFCLFIIGILAGLAGTAAAFWHINHLAAYIFIGCSALAFFIYLSENRKQRRRGKSSLTL